MTELLALSACTMMCFQKQSTKEPISCKPNTSSCNLIQLLLSRLYDSQDSELNIVNFQLPKIARNLLRTGMKVLGLYRLKRCNHWSLRYHPSGNSIGLFDPSNSHSSNDFQSHRIHTHEFSCRHCHTALVIVQ